MLVDLELCRVKAFRKRLPRKKKKQLKVAFGIKSYKAFKKGIEKFDNIYII